MTMMLHIDYTLDQGSSQDKLMNALLCELVDLLLFFSTSQQNGSNFMFFLTQRQTYT